MLKNTKEPSDEVHRWVIKNLIKLDRRKKEVQMNVKSPLVKAELWTKLKTIRDDKNTPMVYAKWCSQVMEYLELLPNEN